MFLVSRSCSVDENEILTLPIPCDVHNLCMRLIVDWTSTGFRNFNSILA